VIAGLARDFDSPEHPCQLLDALVVAERRDGRATAAAVRDLADAMLVMRLARDLREVGDAQHLAAVAELAQLATDDLGDAAANAGIHLVEYEAGARRAARCGDLHGEADAGEFAAGGDARDGLDRLARICAHEEFDALRSVGTGFRIGVGFDADFESPAGHAQLPHQRGHGGRELAGRGTPRSAEAGQFWFNERMHDTGGKVVLGQAIKGGGIEEGERVLDLLERHPSTARFIAAKLARRFVADQPPAALVDRVAATFRATDGDLREVVRVIVTSPEFFAAETRRAKIKTPFEFVISALRATGADVQDTRPLARTLQQQGMPLYLCQPPTGYKETADAWVTSGALVTRMNFAVELANGATGASVDTLLYGEASETTRATIGKATTPAQVVALALGSPEFQRR